MTENKELKIKQEKEKERRKKAEGRTTKLIKFYKDKGVSKEDINLYRSLIQNLAFTDVMVEEYREDMLTDGYQVKYMNGKNQWGYKKSEATELFEKWSTKILTDSEKLHRILFGENSGELDKELFDLIKGNYG